MDRINFPREIGKRALLTGNIISHLFLIGIGLVYSVMYPFRTVVFALVCVYGFFSFFLFFRYAFGMYLIKKDMDTLLPHTLPYGVIQSMSSILFSGVVDLAVMVPVAGYWLARKEYSRLLLALYNSCYKQRMQRMV